MDAYGIKITLILAALIIVSVFASKITSKFGIPILLLFIGMGMLAGSDGPGGIHFTDLGLTQTVGTISLVFVLFYGGLATKIEEIKSVWKEGALLSTMGVIASTAVMTFFVKIILNWDWVSSALLSAAVASTDSATIFGIFLTQKMHLKSKLQKLLELESSANDPLAVFLTLTLISISRSGEFEGFHLFLELFLDMGLGALAGWVLGRGVVSMINVLDLETSGLYPVLSMAGVMCVYCLTEYCGGNGFLAVYIAGLTMGQERYFSKRTLLYFHDGLAWIMQSAMFLILGLLVFASELPAIAGTGVIISLILILIARPLSLWICVWKFNYSWKELVFLSWGGLRGAVPVILATSILASQINKSHEIFNLVFFIVLLSMIFQGTSLKWVAKFLKLTEENPDEAVEPFISERKGRDFHTFSIKKGSILIGKSVLELQLPEEVLVVLISRNGHDLIPGGSTELMSGDKLVCLCSKNKYRGLKRLFHH